MYPEQYLIHRKYSSYTSSHPFFFSLKVRGYPEPQVTWHRNGQPITSGGRSLLDCGTRGTFSLLIHAVLDEDKGKYTCEATNGSGARQVTVELTVEGESQEVKTLGRDKPSVSYGLQLLLQPSLGRGTQRKHSHIPELRTLSSYGVNVVPGTREASRRQCRAAHHLTSGFSLPFASPHTEIDWMDSPSRPYEAQCAPAWLSRPVSFRSSTVVTLALCLSLSKTSGPSPAVPCVKKSSFHSPAPDLAPHLLQISAQTSPPWRTLSDASSPGLSILSLHPNFSFQGHHCLLFYSSIQIPPNWKF